MQVYVIKAFQEPSTEYFISSKSAQGDGKTAQDDNKVTEEGGKTAQGEADGVIKWADAKESEKQVKPLRFRFVRRTPQKLDMQSKSEEQ